MRLYSLLASVMVLSPSLVAQRFPEAEPNDSAGTAQPVTVGTQIDATLVAAEQDWFSFTLANATRVRIHTSGVDTRIALLDAAGTTYLGIDDDSRTTTNQFASELQLELAGGSYTIQVVGFGATTAGTYSLDLAELTPVVFTGTEVEPNDTHLTATSTALVPGGSRYQGNLGPATVQFADLVASGTTTVITATAALTAGQWTQPASGFGRFYVRYTSGANSGLYRQITSNTATTITTSSFPTAPTAGDTYVVELVDVDYWQVVLTAPTHGIWFQINEAAAPWVYGHRWEIYDSTGTLLVPATSTTVPAFGTNNGNASTLVPRTSQIRVWPAGTYYIAVRPPAAPFAAAGVMPAGTVPLGNYMLELHDMPMDVGGVVPEAAEPNNTPATATPIAPGQTGQGNITNTTGADSSDWWGPITISSPSTITYQTRQGAGSPLGDSTIILRDVNGAALLTSTTGNLLAVTTSTSGLHARATVTFYGTPITGYIEVVSPGTTAAQAGDYELQISALAPAPYVAASYATFAANGACGAAPFPTLTRQFTSEVPAMGSTFARQLTNCPPSAIYVHMIGFSNTLFGGSTPLPIDLTPLGAPGCTIDVDPVLLTVGITDAAGVADVLTTLPPTTAFRGFTWWEQGIVNNPAANAFGAQFSNFARAITGERSF